MAATTKKIKSTARKPTKIEQKISDGFSNIKASYIEGYRQGVKDACNYKKSPGAYTSASYGYYRGLKDSVVVRRVNKRTKR